MPDVPLTIIRRSFHDLAQRTGPLTWPQQAIRPSIAWLRQDSHYFNMSYVLEVHAECSRDDVADAMIKLVERHETLRTKFADVDGEECQIVHGSGDVTLRAFDVQGDRPARELEYDAELIVAGMRSISFNMSTEWPVRFLLITAADKPRYIGFIGNKAAMDGGSLSICVQEMDMLLGGVWYPGDEERGQRTPWQPIDQAFSERSEDGRRESERSARYWRAELSRVPVPLFPENKEPPTEPRIHRIAFDSQALAVAGLKLSQELGVHTGTVLLGAVSAMLGDFTGNSMIALQLIVSNRFDKRTQSMVGLMNEDGLMTLSLAGESFHQIVRSAQAASMRAYMRGHYDPSRIECVQTEMAQQQGLDHIDISAYFNNFPYAGPISWEKSVDQGLSRAEVVARKERSKFRMISSWPRQDSTLFIHSNYDLGIVTLHAVTDTARFSLSSARAFLRGIEELIIHAAFGEVGPGEIAEIGAAVRAEENPGKQGRSD
jgi:hypothetical protein